MADETTTETQSSNFRSMGGAGPVSPDGQLAELDAIQSRAGAAANRAAGGRQESGAGRSVSLLDPDIEARLTEIEEAASIAATAQADLEREGYDVNAVEELDEDDEDDDDEELTDEEIEADDTAAAEPTEQPRYSRRDAARLAAELETTKRALQTRAADDQRILLHLQEQSGYTVDGNGRFRYENLREKVLSGSATRDERDAVERMTSWHQFAGPIFQAAEDQVYKLWNAGYHGLVESTVKEEKLDSTTANQLRTAAAKGNLVREAFRLGREAERKAVRKTTDSRSAAPTPVQPTHHQPVHVHATTSGGAANPAFMRRFFDPKTGLLRDDVDHDVKAGKWLGVDLAKVK